VLARSLNWALALCSALLLVLAFPNANLTWLAPFALMPLLVAVAREERWRRRFLLGWSCGIAYWFGVCYWIQFVLSVHGGVGDFVGWLLLLLFALAKGLHTAFYAALAGPLMMRRWWAIPAAAALWVAIESTHGSLGFEWLQLGNAGIDMGIPLALVSITGVYGASFLFAAVSAGLAVGLVRKRASAGAWLAVACLLVLAPAPVKDAHSREEALLLQPNISETEEWTPEKATASERELETESLRGSEMSSPSVIVWPEIPAPFYFYDDSRYRGEMEKLAQTTHASLLFGTVARSAKGAWLNSAALVSPSGSVVSRYDKVHLVPFGEFVPWPFGFANKISTEVGDFEAGTQAVVSPIGSHFEGTFICYESVFPDFVRRFVKQGAEVLFTISNDGWFGKTAAREQHLQIVRMRAAENKRWILRAANDGVTVAVDPEGKVEKRLPSFERASLRADFAYLSEETLYTRWGNWFPLLCAIVAAGCLAAGWNQQRA
jgi:apolipoprotein N-acyltransferase